MAKYSVIGKSIPRVDSMDKVTGRAEYTGDIILPTILHGRIARSPYAHARIISIDTSKAEKLPGVRVVVTSEDVPSIVLGSYLSDMRVLPLDGIVRYVGEPVALVAADSLDIAEEAVELIEVKYEELPAVFDVEEAFSKNPPVIVHEGQQKYEGVPRRFVPDRPNVSHHFKIRTGDIEKGFKEADVIVEGKYSTPPVVHCQTESHQSISWVKADGTLVVRTSTQGIHATRGALIEALHLPANKVEVYCPYSGGGFGGKTWLSSEPYSAVLALKSGGRPVKVAFSREEMMVAGGHRAPITITIKDGVKRDGTLVAREVTILLEHGGYAGKSILIVRNCSFAAGGVYRVPHFKLDSYGVYTNNPYSAAFRGFGASQVVWGIENQMDVIAEKIGMDPIELRVKNFLREGDTDATGQRVHRMGAEECLRRVARFIQWGEKPVEGPGPWKNGKGVASSDKYILGGSEAVCEIKVYSDGLEVRHGTDELGTGHDTVMAQVAAEEFGVPVDQIKVVHGNSVVCPYDWASISNRSVYHAGNALIKACRDAKRQMFELAAPMLGCLPDQLETSGGKIRVKGTGKEIPVSDLFGGFGKACVPQKGEILGIGHFRGAYVPEDENGQSPRIVLTHSQGSYGVEVAVNTETGEVKVVKTAGCFDAGQPVNPKMCEAQIEGGVGMGIGVSLTEEVVLDKGRVINPSFADYKILSAADMPTHENLVSMVTDGYPDSEGPFGARGLGEMTLVPYSPAVSNAVYDAIGIRIHNLPITREKVLTALKKKAESAGPPQREKQRVGAR